MIEVEPVHIESVTTTPAVIIAGATTPAMSVEVGSNKGPQIHTAPNPELTAIEIVGGTPVASLPIATIIETPDQQETLTWGVFTGSNPTAIEKFDTYVTTNPDYLAFFVHWGNGGGELPKFLKTYAYNKNRTLVIFWEPSDYMRNPVIQPEFTLSAILRGEWDEYITDFAAQIERYKGEVILVPFSEMNGNWNSWSGTTNGNSPEEAVRAYQYVHGFFTNVENVKFGWAPNSVSVPNTYENRIEAYYPGDTFVDYVGVDGFNKGTPWYSFNEIFGSALTTISQYGKPIIIFSFASAEGPQKASWMKDAFFTQMPKYPLLHGWIWFNQDKERNWLVWSDEDALGVFLKAAER
jgi:endoglucanase